MMWNWTETNDTLLLEKTKDKSVPTNLTQWKNLNN